MYRTLITLAFATLTLTACTSAEDRQRIADINHAVAIAMANE